MVAFLDSLPSTFVWTSRLTPYTHNPNQPNQVLGPMTMEHARCLELSATIIFQAGDHETALAEMERALAIYWQVRRPGVGGRVCVYM